MNAPQTASPLVPWLAKRIRAEGPLTFAEYMRECLYHPEWGYYSRPEARRFADYYTSVDVHPIFGRLVARQLEQMWRLLGRPAEFRVAEAAAGTGRLASQILDFAARELGKFYGALRYTAVELSAARRAEHERLIGRHIACGRAASSAELPAAIPAGCILSNELLDALPVHRVVIERGRLREVYIALRDGALAEELGAPSTQDIEEYFRAQGIALAEGQRAEAGLEVCRWIEDAGRRLERGFVLTVDYGHAARELYDPRHMRGTLLAYSNHGVNEDFLAAPGLQDLTAHVNFTALDLWGRKQGLAVTGRASQMAFLVALGRANEFADLYDADAGEVERMRARLKLKTLIHPEGMGETFEVFIQHKGLGGETPALTGLKGL